MKSASVLKEKMRIPKRIVSFFYPSKSKRHLTELLSHVHPGDICVDCGANVGVVTIPMLQRGAIVHAFEPNPYAFNALTGNIPDALKSNLFLHQVAVAHKAGTFPLYLHENSHDDPIKWSTGSSLNSEKNNIKQDTFVNVNVIRLTEYIQKIDRQIQILKIDIEGAEYPLLDDLIDTGLYKRVNRIYVETHAHKNPGLRDADKNLRKKIKDLNINNIYLDWI